MTGTVAAAADRDDGLALVLLQLAQAGLQLAHRHMFGLGDVAVGEFGIFPDIEDQCVFMVEQHDRLLRADLLDSGKPTEQTAAEEHEAGHPGKQEQPDVLLDEFHPVSR